MKSTQPVKCAVQSKYVFLDFDGVVTSHIETPGSYVTHDAIEYGASPSCIDRLKRLCESTGSKIIVSSNWRRFDDLGKCSFWLNPKNGRIVSNPLPAFRQEMQDYIAGELPKCRGITKSQALILWFEENDLTDSDIKFVVFDDDLSEEYQNTCEYHIKDHFVLTDPMTGLTDADIEKAKAIFEK